MHTQEVESFLDRTDTRNKLYFFHFDDKFIENEWGGVENIGGGCSSFYVSEVASEFTERGGWLGNIDEKQLATNFANMRGWKILYFHVVDRKHADAYEW